MKSRLEILKFYFRPVIQFQEVYCCFFNRCDKTLKPFKKTLRMIPWNRSAKLNIKSGNGWLVLDQDISFHWVELLEGSSWREKIRVEVDGVWGGGH